MKKITIILLMAIYLVPSVGFSVNAHYCGGKLASVSLDFLKTKKCKCGNKKMNPNCCKTKTFSLKINDSQKQTPQLTFDFNKNFKIQPEFAIVSTNTFQTVVILNTFLNNHHPPDQPKQEFYLLNQVFRI
ncbi:MAG: hypothetical protein H0W84_02490 [Bacteroidetes bacterium]|nr:hypothetical protein [Bacteroidota bacterium]